VGPEHAWAWESGIDIFPSDRSTFGATVFGRLDHDVIDWLRPSVADRWQTYNIRDVDTVGLELRARKTFADGAWVSAEYTGIDLEAASVDQLSKYVLDYAPHSFTAAALVPLPGAFHAAPRIEYRRRLRSAGTADYVLLDARVGCRIGRLFDLFVEGSNLFDVEYQEISGVVMPGATVSVGLAVRPR
jgi:outer membrane receptor protein involved in Fe transport